MALSPPHSAARLLDARRDLRLLRLVVHARLGRLCSRKEAVRRSAFSATHALGFAPGARASSSSASPQPAVWRSGPPRRCSPCLGGQRRCVRAWPASESRSIGRHSAQLGARASARVLVTPQRFPRRHARRRSRRAYAPRSETACPRAATRLPTAAGRAPSVSDCRHIRRAIGALRLRARYDDKCGRTMYGVFWCQVAPVRYNLCGEKRRKKDEPGCHADACSVEQGVTRKCTWSGGEEAQSADFPCAWTQRAS